MFTNEPGIVAIVTTANVLIAVTIYLRNILHQSKVEVSSPEVLEAEWSVFCDEAMAKNCSTIETLVREYSGTFSDLVRELAEKTNELERTKRLVREPKFELKLAAPPALSEPSFQALKGLNVLERPLNGKVGHKVPGQKVQSPGQKEKATFPDKSSLDKSLLDKSSVQKAEKGAQEGPDLSNPPGPKSPKPKTPQEPDQASMERWLETPQAGELPPAPTREELIAKVKDGLRQNQRRLCIPGIGWISLQKFLVELGLDREKIMEEIVLGRS